MRGPDNLRSWIVAPVALGKGRQLFSELAVPTPLELYELEGLSGGRPSADLSAGVNPSPKVGLPAMSQGQLLAGSDTSPAPDVGKVQLARFHLPPIIRAACRRQR
jgi:hypothetical protein